MKKENIPNHGFKLFVNENQNQKLPKPLKSLIEKKRRARINRSLSDLRILISDLLKKELMRTRSKRKSGKVEKADVLELAVQYIKEMKKSGEICKELAFEQGYQKCQFIVEDYFRKMNELNKKQSLNLDSEKSHCCRMQCPQCKQKMYLVQKELLKTLDQQWTEHVQNINYNRKLEEQRFLQERSTNELQDELPNDQPNELPNDQLNDQMAFTEKASSSFSSSSFSDKQFIHPSDNLLSINPSNSFNEKINNEDLLFSINKMNILTLKNLNSSKNQLFNSPSMSTNTSNSTCVTTSINAKKFYPTIWKEKQIAKVDELISIKMYNELVMNNLNRNKSLCSSASSTSSCSSASSFVKTLNNLSNNHLTNYPNSSNQLTPVMPTDLDTVNHSSSSASSCCSTTSLSSIQYSSNKNKDQDRSSVTLAKYSHSNSPFKKRKKVLYQYSSSNQLWRPW